MLENSLKYANLIYPRAIKKLYLIFNGSCSFFSWLWIFLTSQVKFSWFKETNFIIGSIKSICLILVRIILFLITRYELILHDKFILICDIQDLNQIF